MVQKYGPILVTLKSAKVIHQFTMSTNPVSALQPAKKPATELAPVTHLSRITPFRVIDLPGGEILREFWKIGCAPTRSMRSALNDPSVARQCAFITVSGDRQTFRLGFYPNGETAQVVKNLPIQQLPQAIDDLIDAGFAGKKRAEPIEILRISV